MDSEILSCADDGQQADPATAGELHDIISGSLVVNRTKRTGCGVAIVICAVMASLVFGIFSAALFPAISNAIQRANMLAVSASAKHIYITIVGANMEREPLGLGDVWPKTGKQTEEGNDLAQMTFKNSTDYFNALYDAEQRKIRRLEERGYSVTYFGFDLSKCAGPGVPQVPAGGRLTAENNAWIIAANFDDDMPDIMPVLISRNVDPASLIPQDGDLSQQFLRPSKKYKTPFGNKGFILVRKGGATIMGSWRNVSLDVIYFGASEEELQAIREKIEYLAP